MTNEDTRPDAIAARQGRAPVRIGDWVLHADLGVIRRDGEERRLSGKALHVLLELIDADGSAVSRAALLDAVWGPAYPGDEVVSRAIADLRSAFGEAAGERTYIRTIPKFGYQLVATLGGVQVSASRQRDRSLLTGTRLLALTAFAVVIGILLMLRDSVGPPGDPRLPPGRPLTSGPGLEHQPRLVSGTDWVVYAALRPGQRDWDLFRVSIDDGVTQSLAATPGVNEHGPAVSPGGDRIAYVRMDASGCRVVTQSMTFGVPEPLAGCTTKFPTLVDWSPDGRTLAYTTAEADDSSGLRRIYLVQLDSGMKRAASAAVSPSGSDFYPRFAPDGGRIAFLRGEPQPDHRSSIWIADPASGIEWRITGQPAQVGGLDWVDDVTLIYTVNDAGRFETVLHDLDSNTARSVGAPDLLHPDYAAGDNRLVAVALRSKRDLAVADRQGNITALASSTSDDHHGSYSPAGDWVAFISRRTGYDELWLVDTASGATRRLTHFDGATVRYPSWHPDGRTILFTAQTGAGERLHAVDVVSGSVRPIDTGGEATTPRWLPNGLQWVYGCRRLRGWAICIGSQDASRRVADNFFRPRPMDSGALAVVDGSGTLYSLSLESGTANVLWDGLPGNGRYGWTIHGQWLTYLAPGPDANSGRLLQRNLVTGAQRVLFEGPMPLADTALSVAPGSNAVLFTRFQAASDDLVRFDAPFAANPD